MKPEELLSHADFVQSLAERLVYDPHHAQDIAQDTWLAVLEHPPKGDAHPRAWITGIAKRIAGLFYRGLSREKGIEANVPVAGPTPEEVIQREETRKIVVGAVLELDEPYRAAILLRFYENLPPRLVAKRLGVPTETARTRIKRGLDKLRWRLDSIYEGDRGKWCLALLPLSGLKPKGQFAEQQSGYVSVVNGTSLFSTKLKLSLVASLIICSAAALVFLFPQNDQIDSPGLINDSEISMNDYAQASHEGEASGAGSSENTDTNDYQREPIKSNLKTLNITGRTLAYGDGSEIDSALVKATPLPHELDAIVPEANTDSTGCFSIQMPCDDLRAITSIYLQVSAMGYLNHEAKHPLSLGNDTLDCGSIKLKENKAYLIEVKDVHGNPIQGACLRFYKEEISSYMLEKYSSEMGRVRITDKELLWGDWLLDFMVLHVSSPGMADFYMEFGGKRCVPNKIVMKPKGWWVGEVIDAETGMGIRDVNLKVGPRSKTDIFNKIIHVQQQIDDTGQFRIFSLSEPYKYNGLVFYAIAEGYLSSKTAVPEKDSKIRIKLKRASRLVKTQVINGCTGKPIPNLKLKVTFHKSHPFDIQTDLNGYFNLPFNDSCSCPYKFKADGFVTLHHISSEIQGSEWSIKPRPAIQDKVEVMVTDEFGSPILGAAVWLAYYRDKSPLYKNFSTHKYTQCGISDSRGYASIEPETSVETEAVLEVIHPDYITYISEPLSFREDLNSPVSIELKRGRVFQEIRVVDKDGKPQSTERIVAELTVDGGKKLKIYGTSDENGWVSMVFPYFKKGILYPRWRASSLLNIDYNTIIRQEHVELILTD